MKGVADRGETLLKFVHREAMKGGYDRRQSSLAGVLDAGKQNCVSAAALVYLVGTHHGFDLRPMSIPGDGPIDGHAYLVLADGKERVVVECTTPDGYDWEAKVKRPGVVVTAGGGIDRKKASEVDAAGLVAALYANRGAEAGRREKPDRPTAAACALRALALAPVDRTAAKNAESAFVNGGPVASKAGRHDEAVRVMEFALAMSPDSGPVKTNCVYCWGEAISAGIRAGKDADAVSRVGRAREQLPKQSDFTTAARWFVSAGWDAGKKDGWEAGIAVFDRGLKAVPDAERKQLREKRYEVARHTVHAMADAGRYAEALTLVSADRLALDAGQRSECGGDVYDAWGRKLAEGKDEAKEKAVAKYAEGVKAYPKHERLAGNGIATVDEWARGPMDQRKWDDAIRIYVIGLKHFPDEKHLLSRKKYCEERKEGK